jgi:hypothetical protein
MGTTYNPSSKTISNFVNSNEGNGYSLCNNKLLSSSNLTTNILNLSSLGTTIYVQITTQNLGKSCTSDPSDIFSFTIYSNPIHSTSPIGSIQNNTPTPICFGNPITISNLGYDANCIDKLRLVVYNANGNPIYTSTPESAALFVSHLNTLATNVPVSEQYPAGSIQNYINFQRGNTPSPNLIYTGYDGTSHINNNGSLFIPALVNSFNQYNFNFPGIYRIKIEGFDINNTLTSTWFNDYAISSPNNYILLKKDDDTYTNNDFYEVPIETGYSYKTLTTYINKKNISITANTGNSTSNPSNCLGAVYIEFENSINNFATSFNSITPLSGANLNDFLNGSFNLIGYLNNQGKTNSNYIRITYMTQPNSNKPRLRI